MNFLPRTGSMDYGIGVDERVYYNLATLYAKPEWDWFHHSIRVTAPTAILPGDWPELGDDYPPEPYVWDRETIGDAQFHQMREDGLI